MNQWASDDFRQRLLLAFQYDDPAQAAAAMRQGLAEAHAAGEMSDARASRMAGIIDRFERAMADGQSDLIIAKTALLSEIAALGQESAAAALDPTGSRAFTGKEASRIHSRFSAMARRLVDEQQPSLGRFEGEALAELTPLRATHLMNALRELGDLDTEAARLFEREQLRPWLVDADEFLRRRHLMVCDPVWPSPAVNRQPNGIAFAGGESVGSIVDAVAAAGGFDVLRDQAGNYAEARWDTLRRAAICVFDLAGFDNALPHDERVGFAQVAYEIGIALALGRPIVVIVDEVTDVPFDIDISPVVIDVAAPDVALAAVGSAIDAAFALPQRGGGESCVPETVARMVATFGDHPGTYVAALIGELGRLDELDPVAAEQILDNAFTHLGAEAPVLLRPAWPGQYPSERHCFHITAFRDWAERTKQLVSESCAQHYQPITYLRGDDAIDSDVIRSIWNEIGRASHIVVDYTDLNLNALIELGMAHVLGRKVLMITQDPKGSPSPPSLSKLRRVRYTLDEDGVADLWAALWTFFGDEAPASRAGAAVEATDHAQPRHEVAQATPASDAAASVAALARPEPDPVLVLDCAEAEAVHEYINSIVTEPLTDVEEGLLSYVLLVPALLEGLHQAAEARGELGKVQPLLALIAEYFFDANDLIPDHQGVVGLVDDAYLALICVQKLNEQAVAWGRPPMVEVDFSEMNQFIAGAMPDGVAAQLEGHLDQKILQHSTTNWLKNNTGKAILGGAALAAMLGAFSGGSGGGGGYSAYDGLMSQVAADHVTNNW